MLANSFTRTIKVLGLSLWVIFGVTLGQVIASILIVALPIQFNATVEATVSAALGYVFAIAITVGLPLLIRKTGQTLHYLVSIGCHHGLISGLAF